MADKILYTLANVASLIAVLALLVGAVIGIFTGDLGDVYLAVSMSCVCVASACGFAYVLLDGL